MVLFAVAMMFMRNRVRAFRRRTQGSEALIEDLQSFLQEIVARVWRDGQSIGSAPRRRCAHSAQRGVQASLPRPGGE